MKFISDVIFCVLNCHTRLWVAVKNLAGFSLSQHSSAYGRHTSFSAHALRFCKYPSNGSGHWSLLTNKRLLPLQNFVNLDFCASTTFDASKKKHDFFFLVDLVFSFWCNTNENLLWPRVTSEARRSILSF